MFIKLDTLNTSNHENDAVIHLDSDEILYIQAPTDFDRKQRIEIASVVTTKQGSSFATQETPEQVLDLIKEAQMS